MEETTDNAIMFNTPKTVEVIVSSLWPLKLALIGLWIVESFHDTKRPLYYGWSLCSSQDFDAR